MTFLEVTDYGKDFFFSLTKSKIQGSYFYVKKKDLSWVTAVCSRLLDFLESSNLTHLHPVVTKKTEYPPPGFWVSGQNGRLLDCQNL